jgi:threonine/homoserine/homoserine lactone efflux protein
MTLNTWLLFLVMETTISLSPGPAVFYVVSQGMCGGMQRGFPAASGIIAANGIYFLLSATSLGAVITVSGQFFTVVKWISAAYLIYLGIIALLAARKNDAVELVDNQPLTGNASQRRTFTGALTLQLANPKALLFFLALVPQFVAPRSSIVGQISILAATSMITEFFILLGYAWLAHRAAHASAKLGVTGNMHCWLARIEGIGLLACATMVLKFRPANL